MSWLRFAVLLGLAACNVKLEPLPRLGQIEFGLTDQTNQPVRSEDLRGRVVIANFMFTSCPTICPALTAKMRELQDTFWSDSAKLILLSFTVDPENDTPDVLRVYTDRNHVNSARWKFLTGSPDAMRAAIDRFRVAHGDREPRPNGNYDIAHNGHFALVDKRGALRGYYRTDDESLDQLRRDARRLMH